MGSQWGPIGDSDPAGSTARTAEVSANHWFAASRIFDGDGNLATGGRLGQTSGDPRRNGAVVKDASRTSEQTAPNPGTS